MGEAVRDTARDRVGRVMGRVEMTTHSTGKRTAPWR